MAARKPLPIGPLARVLRHLPDGSAHRTIVVLALILGMTLLAGIGLLLH
ncbi:hypothetical protein [Actinoplanes sp. NPDC049802]